MGKEAKSSEAYRDGWEAARDRQSRNCNAYSLGSADRARWFIGYDTYLKPPRRGAAQTHQPICGRVEVDPGNPAAGG